MRRGCISEMKAQLGTLTQQSSEDQVPATNITFAGSSHIESFSSDKRTTPSDVPFMKRKTKN